MKNIQKYILLLAILMAGIFSHGLVAADNNCSVPLQITYPNGEKGCLNNLPVSKKISKQWRRSIGDVVKISTFYAVVISDSCDIYEVFTSPPVNNHYLGEKRIKDESQSFIGNCAANCNCSTVVMNGSVLISKNLAMSLGSTTVATLEPSKTPENAATLLGNSKKNSSSLTQSAPAKQALVPDPLKAERDRLALDLEASRKRQQDLEEQLRVSQASKQKEQERLLAEQKAKDQQKLTEEARLKEQQLQALDAQNKDQLRIAQEVAKQKEQERLMADQKVKDQLRVAEETSKANALELSKLKEELANMKLQKVAAAPTASFRKALVIGNDNYSGVSKLVNARQDANAVGRTLSELGYKVMVKNDLNEKEMKATLRQFKNDLEGGDEVIFFYAGHGVQLGSTNYLLPIDIKGDSEDQVRDDAIQLQRLLDDMNEKKVKLSLAIIDACRDNPFPKSGRNIGGRGLAPATAATGQMIIFSAGSGQQALDKLGANDKNPNGLFTRMLLSEMKAPGVRVDNMIRDVRRKVVEAAKSVGHDQVPAIYDQVVGDFYLNK
jgi:hypothetical protein